MQIADRERDRGLSRKASGKFCNSIDNYKNADSSPFQINERTRYVEYTVFRVSQSYPRVLGRTETGVPGAIMSTSFGIVKALLKFNGPPVATSPTQGPEMA